MTNHFVLTYHRNVHDCFNMYFFCECVLYVFCVSTSVDCLSAQYDVRKYCKTENHFRLTREVINWGREQP